MQSYKYEVIVSEKRDEDGKVTREAKIIDKAENLLERPDKFKLLLKNAETITKMDASEEEVSVNVVSFFGQK